MSTLKFFFKVILLVTLAVADSVDDPLQWNSESFDVSLLKDDNPDVYLSTPELIKRHGYPVEIHKVQTDDGYILEMHRIPHGINGKGKTPRPVVFLQHGFICSSSDWVIMGPGKGFAYILADAGYDVWMGNARGNRYSRKHASLDPDKAKFWEFSFDEMGYYDLPAEIDHVLAHTGQQKLFYAGHSMGTTMFYAMASRRPEYNGKIKAMFSLAPVAFMGRLKSPIRLLAPFTTAIKWLTKMIGMNEFLPSTNFMSFVGDELCREQVVTQGICNNILFLLCGYDSNQLNETTVPVIIGHVPAGTSTRAALHFAQEINSRHFRRYDYGIIGNLRNYGSLSPPDYDLNLITAPVYLHYSDNDWMANEQDVLDLYKGLGNVKAMLPVPHLQFNHLDFLWATDVKELLYDKILSLMNGALNAKE
ncbi:hypothetical protein J437_LFUL009942 [Ladona fulva]|uniref:Lipase n=1 Tax=Ladona fulva TaxID=123851 RepID=A0A8K0K8H8_LADFU|nr:hypothetical protein J437_LFUL009942 [Ladona fulva]